MTGLSTLPRRSIDKGSAMPYWHQLREILGEAIESGGVPVGAQLPSEAALCARFGVSRTVVRQALNELENEGAIVREKGRGSFVARPKTAEHLVQALTGLHEDVAARGQELASRVMRLERVPASTQVARRLDLGEEDEIVLLERLRFVDGEPWVYTVTHMPHELCAGVLDADMSRRSLYDVLENDLGLALDHGVRSVEAARAGGELAEHLALEEGAPVLVLRSTTYGADGRPVEYFSAWHRGDRSRFDVSLRRRRSSGIARVPTMVVTRAGEPDPALLPLPPASPPPAAA